MYSTASVDDCEVREDAVIDEFLAKMLVFSGKIMDVGTRAASFE